MADEFTPITSQEDLDRIVEEKVKERHGALTAENAALKTAALKARVAHETGLPYELAARLSGDTEEDIRKDAQMLGGLLKKTGPTAPPASHEDTGDGKKAAFRALAGSLTSND